MPAMITSVADLQRIAQGREAEIFAWDEGRVLRLFRGTPSRESLEHEAAAMRAARAVVPCIPEVFAFEEVDGRPGMIMERIDGTDMITLLGSKPWLVWRSGTQLGQIHATLHEAVASPELPPLTARLLRVLDRADLSADDTARIRAAIEAMPQGDRVCHGDFHPGNVIVSRRGPVVIDWPNATAGDPAADFARTDLLLKMGEPPPGTPSVVKYLQGFGRKLIRTAYRRAYLAARPTPRDVVDRWQTIRAFDRLYGDRIESERESLLEILWNAGLITSADASPVGTRL